MMLNNIPQELRLLPHWVVANADKIPLNPRTGAAASVTDPSTWATFDEAIRAGRKHVGFVLASWDNYTIIDLDNKPEKPCTPEQWARHEKILTAFNSYTERSASGTGYHIIVKGKIPAGVHRDNVEVYSTGRYMICTGDVVRNAPIENYQQLLDILYGEMKPAEMVELVHKDSRFTDAEIVDMAMRASNADKFNSLCAGNMTEYPSQSEADFALLSILAFYTPDNEQVRRIFRMTALGKREKAIRNDTYLNFALGKIRAHDVPEVDLNQLLANASALLPKPPLEVQSPQPVGVVNQNQQASSVVADNSSGVTVDNEVSHARQNKPAIQNLALPPGFVGELAQYFYSSSIRPVPEISLMGAIGCVAGVVGRAYNISGQGLAQYLILLAQTGTGKEAMASGISRLFTAVRDQIPMVTDFLGPAVFASGPALHRVLSEKPCFVSVLGEFGFTVQRLSSPKASAAEQTLKQLILDAYGKSGYGQILQASVYSDREKNVSPVASPNITILGESTPSSFYDGLDESHIASGFLSRFIILESISERPPRNRNFNAPPPPELLAKFKELVTVALSTQANNTCCPVAMDANGQAVLDAFDTKADNMIRGHRDTVREIWNRAHLKALKLSGVIAVGCNPHSPVVTREVAEWACSLVERDCAALQERFATGNVGVGDSKQLHDVIRVIENYFDLSAAEAAKFGTTAKMYKAKLIPWQYVIKKTYSLASFKNDKLGSTNALKRTIQTMVETGSLKEIPSLKLEQEFEFGGKAYGIGRHWLKSNC